MEGAAETVGGWLLAAATLVGHFFLCVGAVNRIHALGLPRLAVKAMAALWYAWLATAIIGAAFWLWRLGLSDFLAASASSGGWLWNSTLAYGVACWLALSATAVRWALMRLVRSTPAAVSVRSVRHVDLTKRPGGPPITGIAAHVARSCPGNQLLTIEVVQEEVALHSLPPELEGLSIVHLSDLHISGRLTLDYYCDLARLTCDFDPDLVLLSGDVCDRRNLVSWASKSLSRIRSRYGNYFILGNHDLRVSDLTALRAELEEAGFVDLSRGGVAVQVAGRSIWLEGDELPWLGPAVATAPAARSAADAAAAESRRAADLRVLVAHSPDRFKSAQQQGYELMFCGHTHGGQVQLPVVGPVLCPSRSGVWHASGWFAGMPTLMRVSRGSGSLFPIRLNCRPDLAEVVLRRQVPPEKSGISES